MRSSATCGSIGGARSPDRRGYPGREGEAWRTVPTTITIGRSDIFVPAEQQEQLRTQFSDVRIVDGDHFLLFLQPDVVTEIIAETFATVN